MSFRHRLKSNYQPTHKFKAKAVTEDGQNFPSKLEFSYYKHLQLLQAAGEVVFFLRQVPIHLPGGIKYILDYQIFYSNGTVSFVDVKGVETPEFILKKKLVEEFYPLKLTIIKKGDF